MGVRKILLPVTAAAVIGGSCLLWKNSKQVDFPVAVKVHPNVFGMIQCWISDTENPVVTEINLDAVERNRNQFDEDSLKQEDGWTVWHEADGRAFNRYRLIEARGNHYKVKYQENGGGTLTSSCIIEFTLETREILRNGQRARIPTLRVLSYSAN